MLHFETYAILFFVMGLVFYCSIIGILRAANYKLHTLSRIGRASLFIMTAHEPLPILSICSKVMTRIIPKQSEINVKYIAYCSMTLILVLIVESVGFDAWKKTKRYVRSSKYLVFLKYC